LSVRMPQSRALESVRSAKSARRAAIRRHASSTVVPSGTVSARVRRSRFTVRSLPMDQQPWPHAVQAIPYTRSLSCIVRSVA
jgi:hypothetical protein